MPLNEHGVEYVLIGGYALAAHGHVRATTDIDVLVPGNTQAGTKLIEALMVLPDQVAKDIDPAWFEEGETFEWPIVISSSGPLMSLNRARLNQMMSSKLMDKI